MSVSADTKVQQEIVRAESVAQQFPYPWKAYGAIRDHSDSFCLPARDVTNVRNVIGSVRASLFGKLAAIRPQIEMAEREIAR